MRSEKVFKLRNIDYFILKAIIQNEYEASTIDIQNKLRFYSKEFVITDNGSLSKPYVQSRYNLLVDLGLLEKVKSKPCIYILRPKFRSVVTQWVFGYMGILEGGN